MLAAGLRLWPPPARSVRPLIAWSSTVAPTRGPTADAQGPRSASSCNHRNEAQGSLRGLRKPACSGNQRLTGLAFTKRHFASSSIRDLAQGAGVTPFDPLHCPISVNADGIANELTMASGYLYFDSCFPIKLGWWDLRSYLASAEQGLLLERIKNSIPPEEEVGHGFKVLGVEERIKDGGAFVSFAYKKHITEDRDVALLEIERSLKRNLKRFYDPNTIILFSKPSLHVVQGRPWRDDLNRFPASRIKVQLQGGDISEERIWEILRPYGRISNIEKKPNEATVTFSRIRGATSARNCAHGMTLPDGPTLVINYERILRSKMMWDWFSNHPRIVFPVILTLLGTITYVVFDPIRAWFVEQKLENTFNLEQYKLYGWLKKTTGQLLGEDFKDIAKEDIWWERQQAAKNISGLLKETPSTFITVSGPRGSGKGQLIERTLQGDVLHLDIDCDTIAKAGKADAALVNALAGETGYWPVFSWLNSLNNLIDLAAVGLIGSKAGFAAPIDAQLRQVLGVVTSALVSVNAREAKKAEKRAKKAGKRGQEENEKAFSKPSAAAAAAIAATQASKQDEKGAAELSTGENGSDKKGSGLTDTLGQGVSKLKSAILGEGEEAKATKEAEAQAALEGEKQARVSRDEWEMEKGLASEVSPSAARRIPVVVIKSFHHKGVKNPVLWQTLAEWSAELVTNGIAHVVFVSDNPVAMGKELTKALPNRPFEGVLLADADELRARKIVSSKLRELIGTAPEEEASRGITEELKRKQEQLGAEDDLKYGGLNRETAECVDKLGGRLTDLETLIQKVSLGQNVKSAVEDIITRTVIELRKNAFGDDVEDSKTLPWSRGQAWTIVSLLASNEELNYYGTLHDAFKGDEGALKAMEQEEIISVRHTDGRPSTIRAGRPVFQEAIKRLVDDRVFANTQRFLSNASAIASNEAIVREVERELRDLAEVYSVRTADVGKARAVYLLEKMADAHAKIQHFDKENAALKKRLNSLQER
ncbi:hypothetical protein K437DRAFT_258710 [Tilletiaria anomala UBC 951]|uniref:Mitochondrial escape protein 2 n=1 Tax=Tilletiaria anomala (strain ATCC 24038 / CBS 436.72 / UBC 951) TaxID=1037660 RepID=A0A066VES9_TILAU|nr:uncharacterized protein K437DRAFT_258710 [Tilletiaria anomala UBC 951]KDN40247.1 hypothetical protein K437DRAFT_258710 [Tilletiaria anomala UBC 951]